MTPQARRERANEHLRAGARFTRDEVLDFAAHEVEQAVARERERVIHEIEQMRDRLSLVPGGGLVASAMLNEMQLTLTTIIDTLRQGAREGTLSDAPCSRCGYNGPGYYQPTTHPCAGAREGAG